MRANDREHAIDFPYAPCMTNQTNSATLLQNARLAPVEKPYYPGFAKRTKNEPLILIGNITFY